MLGTGRWQVLYKLFSEESSTTHLPQPSEALEEDKMTDPSREKLLYVAEDWRWAGAAACLCLLLAGGGLASSYHRWDGRGGT